MKKCAVLILCLVLVALCALPAGALAEGDTIAPSENGYIVKLADNAGVSLMSCEEQVGGHDLLLVDDASRLAELIASGCVEYYEPNGTVKLFASANDTYYSSQWNLSDIQAGASWDAGMEGGGVVIAIIDSGIDASHEDLRNVDILAGIDVVTGSTNVSDELGHGTQVAGIIAAERNNRRGIAGLISGVKLLPIKCFESTDEADVMAVCRGVYAAVDTYGCDVICLSLGTDTYSQALLEATNYAQSCGVIVVAAVGNGGGSAYFYPAAYDSVIGVGAYDDSGVCCSFSQNNDSVFVSAPGTGIYSTYSSGSRSVLARYSNEYSVSDGTSFSAPHVAAMAAIAKAYDPTLTPDEFRYLLIASSVDAGTRGYDVQYGYGKINISSFIDELIDGEYVVASFTDVSRHWAREAIEYNVKNGWFSGVSKISFAPDAPVTRAMLVTVLWRAAGKPAAEGYGGFADVTDGSAWYFEAVYWAASNGIVEGSDGLFRPDDHVTREQIATILWRYLGSVEADSAVLAAYSDAARVSDYAVSAMSWACAAGIINGSDGALQPGGSATRAQAATILMRIDTAE